MSLGTRSDLSRGRFSPYALGIGLTATALLNIIFGVYAWLVGEPLGGYSLAALLGTFMLLAGISCISKKYCTKLSASVPTRIRSPKACRCKLSWKCNSFALYIHALRGNVRSFWRNREFRAHITIIGLATLFIAVALRHTYGPLEALRHSLFQVLNILTTTGYASVDYNGWPVSAQAILVALMLVGGSAAGGVKIVRWFIIGKNTGREIRRALHPRAVIPLNLDDVTIPEDVMRAVAAFVTLFITLTGLLTLALTWFGADYTTALAAAVACLGNLGPGLAGVGPMGSFSSLHPVSQLLLNLTMIAGRLEILALFIVFDRRFWLLPRRVQRLW